MEWPGGLGAQQLHNPFEQPGEALLVPRPHLAQCGRVPAQLGDQRQLPGAGEREQPGAAVHLGAVRGEGVPLPHQRGFGWKSTVCFLLLLSWLLLIVVTL